MKKIWRSLLLTIPLAILASLIFTATVRAQIKNLAIPLETHEVNVD